MQFTAEQTGVIDSRSANIVVNAFAGTGKTTTLRGYALARPRARILYLAFNKAMAQEAAASFPGNVDCRTMHSLAYSAVGHRYRHKLGPLRPNDLLRHYSDVSLVVADALVKTLEHFMYSASPAISEDNVPQELPMSDRLRIAHAAQQVWRGIIDEASPLPLPHDAYLKLYQLSMPVLSKRYDIILLDEAQDTNLVTADVVFRQRCGKVLVGDRHQSIYGFRGNVNVMDMLPDAEVHYLTRSMRFGGLVANAATTLLRYLKAETHVIVGGGTMAAHPDRIDHAQPFAIISRTNAGVFNQAVNLLGQRRVHFVGGLHNSLFGKLRDIYGLWSDQGELVQDAFYREFGNFDALATYGRQTLDKEILSLVSVVNQYRAALPDLMEKVAGQACAHAKDAQVMLLTAHRSKGLQFDQVLLDDDYQELVDKKGRRTAADAVDFEQEVNLLYVAMTRARRAIQFNRQYLAFIEAVDKGTVQPIAA